MSLPHYLYWLGAFLLGVYFFGFILALLVFFIAFLRIKAKASWLRTVILTACAMAFLMIMSRVMVLDFPRGILQNLIELPWPIG